MQKRYIPIITFFVVLLVVIAHLSARVTAVPAFTHAETKKVYLTFDDGPSTKVTGKILDVLEEEDVKATFFIVSDRVAGREETLKRIARDGHTLGIHSKTHRYSEIYASDEVLLADIRACRERIEKVTGVTPSVYRFPGGSSLHQDKIPLVKAEGLRPIGWNAVCGDEEIPHADAETLYEQTFKTAQGKNPVILLMHDSAPHKATAEALPRIIAEFKRQGFEFCAY